MPPENKVLPIKPGVTCAIREVKPAADRRSILFALWTPAITTVGAVLAACISAWSGCQDLRADVKGVQRAVDAQTSSIDRLGARVDQVDDRSRRNALRLDFVGRKKKVQDPDTKVIVVQD